MQKLEIKTLPVTIKVLTVEGKRLTASVFWQIPESGFFPDFENDVFNEFEYIGWVRIVSQYNESKYILFRYDNILWKHYIFKEKWDKYLLFLLPELQLYISI